jgi:diguanylate cyclase (GGDEF)-like protein
LSRINHSLGAKAGDELLVAIARRLQHHFAGNEDRAAGDAALSAPPAIVARTGGDEFCIAITQSNDGQIANLLPPLLAILSSLFQIGAQDVAVGVTMGVALFPEDADSAETLLRSADAALHQAKIAVRGGYQFFSAAMQRRATRRLTLESDLRRAVQRGQLELHYQPRLDAKSLRPAGAEALLRWQHPDRGLVSPTEFIPVAEDLGLILELGEWALDKACEHAAQLSSITQPLRMAVNVSAVQLQRADIVEQIGAGLQRHRVDPARLEIEVTEGVFINSPQRARQTLERLKSYGIHIALDDFGTGYSSLSYLRTLPIDYLKIDRSFIAHIPGDRGNTAIVSTILTLAQGLELKTIAEGIEQLAQQETLVMRGCDELQGFLFAKPMSFDALRIWLAEKISIAS